MRRIYIDLKVRVIVNANDDVDLTDIIQELNYEFLSNNEQFDIVDTEITDYELID